MNSVELKPGEELRVIATKWVSMIVDSNGDSIIEVKEGRSPNYLMTLPNTAEGELALKSIRMAVSMVNKLWVTHHRDRIKEAFWITKAVRQASKSFKNGYAYHTSLKRFTVSVKWRKPIKRAFYHSGGKMRCSGYNHNGDLIGGKKNARYMDIYINELTDWSFNV